MVSILVGTYVFPLTIVQCEGARLLPLVAALRVVVDTCVLCSRLRLTSSTISKAPFLSSSIGYKFDL